MRSGFIGSRPLHLVPFFIRSPFTHFFFLFMSSLASCLFISLLSFSCAHNGPCLSLHAHTHFQTQVKVAQVLSLCTWFLLHRNPHILLSRLVLPLMSSSFCLCCAHIYTFVLALILPPLREACVCVCVPLVVTGIHLDCLVDFCFFLCRGTVYPTEVTVQRRGFCGGTDITGDVQ